MARTLYSRNSYDGGATQASLSVALDASSTTVILANTSATWNPLGASNGFFMSLGYGTQSEEKVYVPAQSIVWSAPPVTLVGVVRGVDGPAATTHDAASPVTVVMTATDLDEANYAVTQTVGLVTTQGDLLYGNGLNALARLAAGTAGMMLTTQAAGAAPTWVDASNVWTGATAYTVSGFASYLVLADVTLTQPVTGFVAGSFNVSTGSKSGSAYCGATSSAIATASLAYVTTASGTITATATKGGGLPATATFGTVSLTVIGLN